VIFFAAPRTSELLFGRDTRVGRIRYPHSLQSPASDDAAVVDPVCHFEFEICALQLSFLIPMMPLTVKSPLSLVLAACTAKLN